jgi:large subunit ribosomal protein L17
MRHRLHRYRLGRVSEHRLALLRNLLVALFRHERITTTEAKAKAVRPWAERMITLAKRESLHARRQVLTMVPDRQVVRRLFDTIAARFSDRPGGYTRIIKHGVRRGDAAPLVFLELVDRREPPREERDKGKAAKQARTRAKEAAAG